MLTLTLLWPNTTLPCSKTVLTPTGVIKIHDFKVGSDSNDYTHILLRKVVKTPNSLIIKCEDFKIAPQSSHTVYASLCTMK